MQQHALSIESIGNSVHTEAQLDIGLTAADEQFHTLCKQLLISGDCWLLEIFLSTFCFKTICYPTFLMNCMDCFYWGVLSSGYHAPDFDHAKFHKEFFKGCLGCLGLRSASLAGGNASLHTI